LTGKKRVNRERGGGENARRMIFEKKGRRGGQTRLKRCICVAQAKESTKEGVDKSRATKHWKGLGPKPDRGFGWPVVRTGGGRGKIGKRKGTDKS